MSSFRWGMVACWTPTNSQVTAREAEATPVFSSLQYCCSFQPQKHASPIWSLSQSVLGAEQATISHLKEETTSYLRIQKFFNFPIYRYHLSLVQITQFQHGFRMLWGQTTFLYIVDCHSATCWSTKSCHTPDERELPEVSYEVKMNDLLHEVAEIWTSELFKYFSPRKCHMMSALH